MVLKNICTPALIYFIFSFVQIGIDTMKGLFNTALTKLFVSLIITFLLNYLCSQGLGIVSWFLVFIPFILMSLIITILLLVFGLDPATGKIIHHRRQRQPINPPAPNPTPFNPPAPNPTPSMNNNKKGNNTNNGFYDNYNDAHVNTIES